LIILINAKNPSFSLVNEGFLLKGYDIFFINSISKKQSLKAERLLGFVLINLPTIYFEPCAKTLEAGS
jgi:hypothetical protein